MTREIHNNSYRPFGSRERPLTTTLCPNCESDKHARCCAWCGKTHAPRRLHREHCSTACERAAAAEADCLSAAMEEP